MVATGGVVVYPTETLWGIGCDATDAEAIRRVLRVKGIADRRPFPVLVSSVEKAARALAGPVPGFAELASAFWPGGLTLVVPVAMPELAPARGPDGTVGFRLSAEPAATALAAAAGGYLISTSANFTGASPPAALSAIEPAFLAEVDGAVDSTAVCAGRPSTILAWNAPNWVVLRPGVVPPEDLAKAVGL